MSKELSLKDILDQCRQNLEVLVKAQQESEGVFGVKPNPGISVSAIDINENAAIQAIQAMKNINDLKSRINEIYVENSKTVTNALRKPAHGADYLEESQNAIQAMEDSGHALVLFHRLLAQAVARSCTVNEIHVKAFRTFMLDRRST